MTESDERSDPFHTTSDPASYVPRPATEEVLSALASFLRVGATQIALRGPPGIGKTLLLRVTAARLEGQLRCVHIAYPALPAEEIAGWILSLMGEVPGADPERSLVTLARNLREDGSGLAVIVDDAGSCPLPTLRRLSRLAAEARPSMRLVLALPDDGRADEIISAIGPGVESVDYLDPMTEEETRAYVESHLVRTGAPEWLVAAFEREAMGEIYRESHGTPSEVSRIAFEWWQLLKEKGPSEDAFSTAADGSLRLGSSLLGPSNGTLDDPWAVELRAAVADRPPEPSIRPLVTSPAALEPAESEPIAEPEPQSDEPTLLPIAPLEAEQTIEEIEAESPATPCSEVPDSEPQTAVSAISAPDPEPEAEPEPVAIPVAPPPRARAPIADRSPIVDPGLSPVRPAPLGARAVRRPDRAEPNSKRRILLVGAAAAGIAVAFFAGRISVPQSPTEVTAPPTRAAATPKSPVETASPAASDTADGLALPDPLSPEPSYTADELAAGDPVGDAAERALATTPTPAVSASPPVGSEAPSAEALADAAPEGATIEPWPGIEVEVAPTPIPSPVAEIAEAESETAATVVASASPVASSAVVEEAPTAAVEGRGDEPATTAVAAPVLPVAVNVNAVPWASIEIDGVEAGVTPLADIPLAPGVHEFRATFADGGVVVRREEITKLNSRILFR